MKSKRHTTENTPILQQRLDTWLWASRFYKTRKLAADSVVAGHIHVNGSRSKPGRTVKIGDKLTIRKNQQTYDIVISGLSPSRASACLAQSLYDESELSRDLRLKELLMQKNSRAGLRYDRNKPDKRDRRRMVEIKNQIPGSD